MIRKSKILDASCIFTILFIFYILFGLVFYDLPVFQLVDEIFPIILFVYSIIATHRIHKYLIVFFGIIAFYILYSICIRSNVLQAIFFDSVAVSKPFLTLFSILILSPKLSPKHKRLVKYTVLATIPVLLYAAVRSYGTELATVQGELLSGARLGFCCIYLALTYYLMSSGKLKDIGVMIMIAAIGVVVPTSKYIVTIIVSTVVFILSKRHKLKFNLITITLMIFTALLAVLLIIDDFSLYMSSEAARGAMYLGAGNILIDYVPFGSGLASFGTPSSATYYSDIYGEYSLDLIYGLTPSDPKFISDAFYPVLAEFGMAGILLFIVFLVYLFRKILIGHNQASYRVGLIVLAGIMIESFSDVTLIGNRGEYAMILLGYIISSSKHTCRLNDKD